VLQEELQRSQQEFPELSAMWICPDESIFFQEMNKKILGQILRVLPVMSVASNKGIYRTGIASVERLESNPPLLVVGCGRDQAPLGGLECEMSPCT
jgi:hypothetical protein